MKSSTKPETIKIKFEGIDSFHRVIFRQIDSNNRFGSCDKLYDSREGIKGITESDLLFFGTSFDCEPMGTPAGNVEIVQGEES